MIACLGFIDKWEGKILFELKYRSFDSADVIIALKKIRDMYPKERVAIFWDNASIHRSAVTKGYAERCVPMLKLVYNLPYRPDLNPIELFWA